MQKIFTILFLVFFTGIILAFSVRGISGNPTEKNINNGQWGDGGPLELSPDRGRFALTLSYVENHSFYFSLPIAKFATPDLGTANGKYVSLFAPAVSFIVIPGYLLGKMFNIAQVGTFAVISLFAMFNFFLVRAIAKRIGANSTAATIGALIFSFATPAFPYAVTLYQHHISTFLILSTLYILLRWKNWISLAVIWFLFAASIPVDYPNLILMLPLALFATGRILQVKAQDQQFHVNIKPLYIFSVITMLLPLLFYVWFSQNSYGKPLQLAGTVQGVRSINLQAKPVEAKKIDDTTLQNTSTKEKTAVGFFVTRNLLNGFYIHLFSPDRGVIYFTPIMLFGILGSVFLWRKRQTELTLIVGVIGADIVLYSLWGDPWGGWAFGSRYLIPSYAMLSILCAVALTRLNKKTAFLILFLLTGIYCIGVNTLGAITSNANPPKVEVLALEKVSHLQQKYTYERDFDYLNKVGSKSYAYNAYLKSFMSPFMFYAILTSIISSAFALLLVFLRFQKNYE